MRSPLAVAGRELLAAVTFSTGRSVSVWERREDGKKEDVDGKNVDWCGWLAGDI